MKKLEKRLSAIETLERLSSQWATKRDVMDIGFIGDTQANKVIKHIKDSIEKQGKILPKGVVPMEKVMDYFSINISYLRKISNEKKGRLEKQPNEIV